MVKKFVIVLILGNAISALQAQDSLEYVASSFQEIVTEIASHSDDGMDFEELSNMIYDLAANPISINSATSAELEKLFWLNAFQVECINQYLTKHGPMLSKYELMYIPGLSEFDAKLIAPFLTFDVDENNIPVSFQSIVCKAKHQLVLRNQFTPEKQKGYTDSGNTTDTNYFTGNKPVYYFRYNYRLYNRINAGFTGDKDAGEEFFSGSNKNGFDFYSFYLQVNKFKFIKTLVLGDYRVNFGQGLVVWSGFNFGKSLSIMNSMTSNTGINYYQSVDENNFFRGAATTIGFKPFEISLWYSRHRVDANITDVDIVSGDVSEVSSLQNSGIHATPSEIADEDALHSGVVGGNITYKQPRFRTGITALYNNYSAYINPEQQLYNKYYFRGRSNYNVSIDYRYRMGHLIVFGEEAVSQSGGVAALNGIQSYINSRLSISLLGRYYQRNYQAIYGKAFGENTRNANERGVYAAFECKPFKIAAVSCYIDLFRFPWISYGIDMPSSGRDFLVQINLNPLKRVQMYLQYRNKSKDANSSGGNDAKNQICMVSSDRLRFNFIYNVAKYLQLRSRLESSWYHHEIAGVSHGYYAGESIEIVPESIPLKLYLQGAWFNTDDFNSRIYAHENDLLYTFSIPSYSDQGYRASLMIKYTLFRKVDLWLKYGLTRYSDKQTVGSGLHEIKGNRKSEIKAQILMKF